MNGKNNGYMLPTVIIYIIIAVIVGMGIFYIGGLERINTRKRFNREKAFYAAEAGAYRAYSHMKDDSGWEPETGPVDMKGGEDGSFIVNVEETGEEKWIIDSAGNFNGTEEKVQLSVGYRNIWSQGIFGSNVVTIGNSSIDGYDSKEAPPYALSASEPNADVGSKESINMDNPNATIYGNAAVSSGNPPTGGRITGSISSNVDFGDPLDNLSDYPVVIPDYLVYAEPPVPLSGTYSLSGDGVLTVKKGSPVTIGSGNYRLKDIVFENDSELVFTGAVNMYVEDRFDIDVNKAVFSMNGETVLYMGENSTFVTYPSQHVQINTWQNDPVNFRIYSASVRPIDEDDESAISINNNRGLVALIYVPLGEVSIKNGAGVYGGIVSDAISIGNGSSIYYDVNLRDEEIDDELAKGPLRILRWTKPSWVGFQ